MDSAEKFLHDLVGKCQSTANHAVHFAATRLFGHARLFPTRLAMRTVELSIFTLEGIERIEKLEEEEDRNQNKDSVSLSRHLALAACFDALDHVDRFINVFRPVTRLEYFAEETTLMQGWQKALNSIEQAQKGLIKILRAPEDASLFASSWDVVDAEEESNGLSISKDRMVQCFESLREATGHVWGAMEYDTNIEFDVEKQRNRKIKQLLDEIRSIAASDKKADTSQSIEAMLDATSVFDAFARQYKLGSIMDKLAKKTKSTRDQIGETIKGHWETMGFDMDDDRAFEMIERFLIENNKSQEKDKDDESLSLDTATRPRVFAPGGYLGSLEECPDVVRISKQTRRSPEPLDSILYPNCDIELPDFEGPSSLQLQWRNFSKSLVRRFRINNLSGCWVWDGEVLWPVWDGQSLWDAVKLSMPPPPVSAAKGGVSLDDDSEEDSDNGEEDEDEAQKHEETDWGEDTNVKWVKEGCVILVAGPYEPEATLIGARHMPSTDDLKLIIVYMATLPTNPKTTRAACHLLRFLLSEAPRSVLAARAHFVWRAGGLTLLLQAVHVFRKDVDLIVLCLQCLSRVLNACPDACIDTIAYSPLPDRLLQLSVDYKPTIARFGPIHAAIAASIDALCNHGGQRGRERFGRRGVDAILSAFRSPAPTEELVRCLCQGLASICNDKMNSRCVFQPPAVKKKLMLKLKSGQRKKKFTADTTFPRGPSFFPQTICRLFISRDVRNNVEMLYRLIHCCNCILLSAWMRPPTKDSNAKDKIETEEKSDVEEKEDEENKGNEEVWIDVYDGVALEDMGEAVMAIMKRWEHPNLDTRCVQLLQTLGNVGSDEVRAKLSVAGLPQLLTSEFLEGVETLPKDGCSNLLNAIRSTTRGDIAMGECTLLLEAGVLEGIMRVMDRHESSAQVQTASMGMLEHMGILPKTKWSIFQIGLDQRIVLALSNHSTDRSTVMSVTKSLDKMIQLPSTLDEVHAANEIYDKERAVAFEYFDEEKISREAAEVEAMKKKATEDFWDVDESKDSESKDGESKDGDDDKTKDVSSMKFSFRPLLPVERLFKHDLIHHLSVAITHNMKDDGVIDTVFMFFNHILIAISDKGMSGHMIEKNSYNDDEDVEGAASCEESAITRSIGRIVPLILNVLRANPKKSKMQGVGGRLLRRMSLSTNQLHDICVNEGGVEVVLKAFFDDRHCHTASSLSGILAALSVYIAREPPPKKNRKLSPTLQAFVGSEEVDSDGNLLDITPTGFERVLDKCCERHAKHVETVVYSMELMSMLLVMCRKRIVESELRTWVRGDILRVVGSMLALHPEHSGLLAVACQVISGCMGTPKIALQILHNGIAQQIINGLQKHGASNPNVVHGACRVVYMLSQSRTVRQLLLSKYEQLRATISNLFGLWAGGNKKVARWGKDCINKLSLPC